MSSPDFRGGGEAIGRIVRKGGGGIHGGAGENFKIFIDLGGAGLNFSASISCIPHFIQFHIRDNFLLQTNKFT